MQLRVKPAWPGCLPVHKATGSHPISQRRTTTSRGDLKSAAFPLDDVHLVAEWSGGTGLASCDLQVAGSIPITPRSSDLPHHRGFGD